MSFLTDLAIIYRYTHVGRHPFSYSDLTVEIVIQLLMSKYYLPAKVTINPRGPHTQPHSGGRTPQPCYLAKYKAVQCHTHGPNIQGLQERKELCVRTPGGGDGRLLPLPVQHPSLPLSSGEAPFLLSQSTELSGG